MEKQQLEAKTFSRRNFYNDDDSGKVFLFALILPILLAILFTLISNLIVGVSGMESEQVSSSLAYTTILQVVSAVASIGLFLVYNKVNNISFSAVKLKFRMPYKNYIVAVMIGVVSLFGLQYFIGAVDDLLSLIGFPLEISSPDMPESLTNPKSLGVFFLSVFVTCLLPAISEELLFRGAILQGLRKRFGDIASIFLSALMFALMHQNLQQLVYPFLLGSIMAWIVLRSGSLFSSMLVHFINNFLVILFTYLSNVTSFSLELAGEWWFYLLALLLLGVTFAIIYLIDRFVYKHKSEENLESESQDQKGENGGAKKQSQDNSPQKTSKYIYISLCVSILLFLFVNSINFVL